MAHRLVGQRQRLSCNKNNIFKANTVIVVSSFSHLQFLFFPLFYSSCRTCACMSAVFIIIISVSIFFFWPSFADSVRLLRLFSLRCV